MNDRPQRQAGDRGDELRPADPDVVGVGHEAPDPMQVEAARLPANDVRPELRDRGFDDPQINEWADTYVAQQGSGDAETFIAWIAEQERRRVAGGG